MKKLTRSQTTQLVGGNPLEDIANNCYSGTNGELVCI